LEGRKPIRLSSNSRGIQDETVQVGLEKDKISEAQSGQVEKLSLEEIEDNLDEVVNQL